VRTVIRITLLAFLLFRVSSLRAAEVTAEWPTVTLAPAREVTLSGPLGAALHRGVARLSQPPYTEPWLRADVSFEVERIFTNYSGDVSGRFLELASLTSPADRLSPPTLAPLVRSVARWQKPDGHFGVVVDLSKPLVKNAPPIPMLWGNARLLVGLIAAAQRCHNKESMAAAKRLGDFYVNTADQLCAPAREADYRSSGTYGDGYCCCYFPAIEGLALLYRATGDNRYLKHAQRMAEFFQKFDCLPVEHSHGNLCAWRGVLELYQITGRRDYLDRARAKWEAAMKGGFVWPLGGVGEHWQVFFEGDEGCSESDWLRFCLDLWRFTGETRYLDVAERLLENQYATNLCPNGGYGMAHVDGDGAGPIAALEKVEEWPFCCSFHGPLGLHFLKGYLAAGSERGIIVNFPYDFTAPVKAAGQDWTVACHSKPEFLSGHVRMEIELKAGDKATAARTSLWVRMPEWACAVKVTAPDGPLAAPVERGYLRIDRDFKSGDKVTVDFRNALILEGRRFQKAQPAAGRVSRLKEVAVLAGPQLLFAAAVKGCGRPVLLATLDHGRLAFPLRGDGEYITVPLPGVEASEAQIAEAVESARPVFLRTWPGMVSTRRGGPAFVSAVDMSLLGQSSRLSGRRLPFMFDLVVVSAGSLPQNIAKVAARAKEMKNDRPPPIYGENLERRPDDWLSNSGWKFSPQGLLVAGGDTGLLDGDGYGDYRFEFELTLPKEGQGITGWIVRAKDEDNCLMFQLQTADSTFNAPQFKTRPNTLRPHRRVGGQWQIAEPVPLPKEVRSGQPLQIAVECRQGTVEVLLDGKPVYRKADVELRGGSVGFRASGPAEQGLFRQIRLRKL
jgi:DUF1680 family protein